MGKHEIYVNEYGDFECRVQRANWPVSIILTRDDDNPETAESAAALFERVFEKREYWLMLAYHQLKVKLIEDMGDDYEKYASGYRKKDSFDLPFSGMCKVGVGYHPAPTCPFQLLIPIKRSSSALSSKPVQLNLFHMLLE